VESNVCEKSAGELTIALVLILFSASSSETVIDGDVLDNPVDC
jgi:hypothetical protein